MELQLQSMFGKKKRKVLIWSVIINILFTSCSSDGQKELSGHTISGETQGTSYQIIIAENHLNFSKQEIDSLLNSFDLALSTYVPNSVVSRINAAESNLIIEDSSGFFKTCYASSIDVYNRTDGAFDPSIYPLVEGWGFMKKMETPLQQEEVDSLLNFVGFLDSNLYRITFSGDTIHFTKKTRGIKFDFNAIAQGYAVDVLANFIRSRGHKNFYVEIGGELKVEGKNRSGENWVIGIDKPTVSKKREIEDIIEVTNMAVATSGNYRNYYEVEGKKYAHTLDPKTGFPVQHQLLSATVIAPTAMVADAYATAFMVFGLDKTKEFINANRDLNIKVVLLFNDEAGEIQQYSTL